MPMSVPRAAWDHRIRMLGAGLTFGAPGHPLCPGISDSHASDSTVSHLPEIGVNFPNEHQLIGGPRVVSGRIGHSQW